MTKITFHHYFLLLACFFFYFCQTFFLPNKKSSLDRNFLETAYDHFITINLTQDLMDERINLAALKKNTEKVLNQKPKIEAIYYLACVAFAFEHHEPSLCENFILKGLEVFPDSFKLPMIQGFVLANLMHRPYEASLFYEAAGNSPESPKKIKDFFLKMAGNQPSKEEQKKIYELMLSLPEGSHLKYLIEKRNLF